MKALLVNVLISLPCALLAQNALDLTGNPTAAPVAAFSVRQLSSAYKGKCMQVRRSSDYTTQDIAFTPAGLLDTTKLKAFVGKDTGYVSIWYDQSGNGLNAVQPSKTNQPTIMWSDTIHRDNGQPSVWTTGNNGYLYYQPVTQLTSQVTRMEVCRNRSGSFEIVEGLGYFQLDLQLFPNYIWVQYDNGNIVVSSGSSVTTTKNLMSINSVRNSKASQLYVNTVFQGSNATTLTTLSTPDTGFIGIRWDNAGNNVGGAAFSETMLFGSVLSDADRQSINYNENWYYSLGFDTCSSTQVALSPSGATDDALYACMQNGGPWAYYYDPAHPLNLLFGIQKDPGNTGANSTFVVDSIGLTATTDPTTVYNSATSGAEGIFALGRYWNVYTHTPLTSPVNVRFFFNPLDTLAIYKAAHAFKTSTGATNVSGLQWFKTVGVPYTPDSLTAMPKAAVKGQIISFPPVYGTISSTISYAEFDGVPSFSGGTGVYIVSNSYVTLPVTITAFTGTRANATTVLSWTTSSGSNTSSFEVERSPDGATWSTIGQVPAAGNSATPLSYRFVDTASLPGVKDIYYRLELLDKDGKSTYSGVVHIKISAATITTPLAINIIPNPIGGEMQIGCTLPGNDPVEIQLQDMAGATIIRRKYAANKGENIFSLANLGSLAPGIYIVRVIQGGTIGVAKAIKQ